MGPVSRLLGPEVALPQLWQDPVPKVDHPLIDAQEIVALKGKLLESGLSTSQLVADQPGRRRPRTAAPTKAAGPTGARIRLAPQKTWKANQPDELAKVLQILEKVQTDFNKTLAAGRRCRSRT